MEEEYIKNISEFEDVFPEKCKQIYTDLIDEATPEIQDAMSWMKKVLEYNLHNGKRMRASMVFSFATQFTKNKQNMENESFVIGTCVEILQAFFLMVDDIVDQSVTRRGQQCWYLKDNIGNAAFNDALLLQMLVFAILKKYLSKHECYRELVKLVLSTTRKTVFGESMDCLTTPNGGKTDFSLLTEDHYSTIVKYKTSFYSFVAPVQSALYLAGIKDEEIHNKVEQIMLRIGYYFSVQDDFIDCYGDPNETGKIGTDIENGKCSWIAVQAVKKMSNEEIEYFKKHFGVGCEKDANNIRSLYDRLNIKGVFSDFEDGEYNEIRKLIENFSESTGIDAEPFLRVLEFLYKRKK